MSDLDDEGRSLFDAARAGYEPNEEDRKRVFSRVLLRAGVAIGVTGAASAGAAVGAPLAGAAASSGVAGLAFKAALWLALGGSVGVGGYAISRLHSGSVNSASTSAPVRTAGALAGSQTTPRAVQIPTPNEPPRAPEGTNTSQPSGARSSDAPNEAKQRSSEPRVSSSLQNTGGAFHATGAATPAVAAFPNEARLAPTPRSASSAPSLPLSVEARALAKVQSALKEGRNAEALSLVEEQQQQFAHGELQQERDAAKIVALCAVGRVAEARVAARDFLANSPRSPFATRIRSSCAGQ
jgi:hypothetical protein